jgi:hypothetical protein
LSVFIDTGIFVAAINVADKNHGRAKGLMVRAMKGEFGTVYTSDYVIDEAITATLARTKKFEAAVEVGEYILTSPRIEKLRVTEEIFNAAWERFKALRARPMSFTDCTSLALVEKNGIGNLASFDSGFDGLVKRIS